ncbi:LOW QUALITY PROTEIN: hypothetical protein PoB_000521200 [Plakobranchus ocellatus]|uniref:Uncharacterized protein n=1 Tax=Plakobranchus ocellatus TaxID=259542 RepID=A0AAV3Y7E0_9GAST|nr:LOW QUALITY PROTEIN: hypothetical protein PoB_000521200 [Plakobranchus ocellatus]
MESKYRYLNTPKIFRLNLESMKKEKEEEEKEQEEEKKEKEEEEREQEEKREEEEEKEEERRRREEEEEEEAEEEDEEEEEQEDVVEEEEEKEEEEEEKKEEEQEEVVVAVEEDKKKKKSPHSLQAHFIFSSSYGNNMPSLCSHSFFFFCRKASPLIKKSTFSGNSPVKSTAIKTIIYNTIANNVVVALHGIGRSCQSSLCNRETPS